MSDELGDRLTQLHDQLPSPSRPLDAVKASVLAGHSRRIRHRRARSVALVAASCVVGLGGFAVIATLTDEDQGTIRTDQSNVAVTEPQTTADSVPVASDATTTASPADASVPPGPSPWIQTVPEPPLEDREAELVVTTGDSVFVWGGSVPNHQDGSEPPFNDGAIADLEDGTWRPVAAAPLPGGSAFGVWTGSEVVVSNAGLIAVYDPTSDSWRELEPPSPIGSDAQPLAVLGSDVVLPFAGLAWDPNEDSWRTLAAAPVTVSGPQMDVFDGDLIVSGAPIDSASDTMALRYNPESDTWIELPVPGSQVYQGAATGVVGNDLVVVSWLSMQARAMDLDTLEWRELPTFPQLTVICFAQMETTADSTAVVSMCGQHAALEPDADRWVAFDPPTTSDTFSLHPVDGGLLIEGSILDTDTDDWIRSPLLGPVTAGGVTADRRVQPNVSRPASNGSGFGGEGAITVEMEATGCVLDVSIGDAVEQLNVRAARERAEADPDSVEFLNQFGRYSLSCPSAAAYADAFDALTVRGERGESRDAPTLFGPPLPATDTPEEMANAVAEFIEERESALGRDSAFGLTGPSGDPVTFLVDVYYDDGPKSGETYTITLEQTDVGWVIAEVTAQPICTRLPTGDASETDCT